MVYSAESYPTSMHWFLRQYTTHRNMTLAVERDVKQQINLNSNSEIDIEDFKKVGLAPTRDKSEDMSQYDPVY